MYKKGDFHMHSTFSDGDCPPIKILNIAKKRGVDILAITDHNCTGGISQAIEYGKEIGIKVIPGVEVSTRYNGSRVHVLGYFNNEIYNDKILIKCLKSIKNHNISEFNKILKHELSINYRSEKICVEKGIEMLRAFGATVILAHPVLLPRNQFKEIIKLGFDGLEARYFNNTEKDTEYFLNYANDNNLIYTAGSDFHRNNELYRAHGLIGDVYLNESEIQNFLNHLEK